MRDAFESGTMSLTGHGGDQIEAYAALPAEGAGRGGVVVIHHMPGFDEATKEITRKLGSWGFAAVCPNLHHREGPGAAPDDAAAASRAAGGVPDDRLVGDVAAAVEHLRGLPGAGGRVATIGFCSGGRQSVLAAAALDVDAAVDCYGAFVLEPPPRDRGLAVGPIRDRLRDLRCPVLGLFGAEDRYPSPEEVAELDRVLTDQGTPHEFHSFEGAGHAFFAVDRPSYRVEAAVEGWRLVRAFLGRHLAPVPGSGG